jgi:uncharacterized membrane protein YjjB (DUF3815 family)
MSRGRQFALTRLGGTLMYYFVSQTINLLLVLLAAWMVPAIIFAIYAYFARLKYPVSESVFGRMVVICFFVITLSVWLPIIAGAIALSLIGHLWSRIRGEPRTGNQETNAARGQGCY